MRFVPTQPPSDEDYDSFTFSDNYQYAHPYIPKANVKKFHQGWDLPPHIIQLMSIPVEQAIAQLIPQAPHPATTKPDTANAFLNAMRAVYGDTYTLTEKGAIAFKSTGSPLVDLFFDLSPPFESEEVFFLFVLLEKAWAVDPLATTKMIFQARSIHEGKGYQQGFYRAMSWVYENHPLTFFTNLHLIVDPTCQRQRDKARDASLAKKRMETKGRDDMGVVEMDDEDLEELKQYPARPHGSYDDLNNMLILAINGQFCTSYTGPLNAMNEAFAPASQKKILKDIRVHGTVPEGEYAIPARRNPFKPKPWTSLADDDLRRPVWEAKTKHEKHLLVRQRFDNRIATDRRFQAFYLVVVDLVVKQLKLDLKLYKESSGSPQPIFGLSYAAKWTVTPGKGTDKQLLIASAIALKLYPGDGVKVAREKLQREVLSPLRAKLNVPEVKMWASQWDEIEYNKVPGRAMARNAKSFYSHDPTGFETYLRKVALGQTTMSGASMFPHELLATAMGSDDLKSRIADHQWQSLVSAIKNSSTSSLKNCLAVADVSGSMNFSNQSASSRQVPAPILPCIALTLLLSELSVPPWSGTFFTFSSNPKLVFIDPRLQLSERADKLGRAEWGQSTNIYGVFKLILAKALRANLAPADMIGTLFVFSDMQFDIAGGTQFTEPVYQTVKREFETAGYRIPELVFWNLAARAQGTPKPVSSDQPGVSLVSGYSGSLMKYFLGRETNEDEAEAVVVEKDGEVSSSRVKKTSMGDSPLETLMKVLSAPSFSGITVVD